MSHRGQNRGHLAWLMVSGHAYDCNTPPTTDSQGSHHLRPHWGPFLPISPVIENRHRCPSSREEFR
jgi:hypothetical protein